MQCAVDLESCCDKTRLCSAIKIRVLGSTDREQCGDEGAASILSHLMKEHHPMQ